MPASTNLPPNYSISYNSPLLTANTISLSANQQAIINEVLCALESDQLDLPVLPDIAIKVRKLLDDPNSSTGQFVQLLSSDLSISLYLIKAANSAAFSTGHPVGNLREAIPRLGYKLLYSMVLSITLTKLFKANSPLINNKLKELLEKSRIVAANSFVLAKRKKHLKPEDALLAGLVREIGALPLYLYADRNYPDIDAESLELLITTFSAPIGICLLKSWNFPDELIDVIADQLDLRSKAASQAADYVDIVTMANLQLQATKAPVSWKNVFAAEKLGCYPGDCKNILLGHASQFEAASAMLG